MGLGGAARLLRYNSHLPLVVYVPAGVEVRHRCLARRTGCLKRGERVRLEDGWVKCYP